MHVINEGARNMGKLGHLSLLCAGARLIIHYKVKREKYYKMGYLLFKKEEEKKKKKTMLHLKCFCSV